MAEGEEIDSCGADLVGNTEPNLALACTSSIDGGIAFRYKLPSDGLALRSVSTSNGVPTLHFGASPKVPTITEEDIATLFRLASEGERPGFFYGDFPTTHPMHGCRFSMRYSPAWLRWTSVGKLLAEADWKMKCLHVGTWPNKKKSVFKSWSEESQLEGLASHVDFPKDGLGPIMMSCDHVRILKDEGEIMFPEEPKMNITDGCSSVYSKYITEIYPSVAYHDEPLLLKMQELIKLIVVVEWLYKEKGVRVNHDWMMQHTSRLRKAEKHSTRNKPPYNMVPKPTAFKCPTRDVSVKTWEALQYKTLKTKCGIKQQYGYYDFRRAHLIMYEEDGTPCPPEKCLKVSVKDQIRFFNMPPIETEELHFLPLPEPTKEKILELLPNTHEEVTSLVPASVDKKVEDLTDERGMKLRVTNSIQPYPLLTMTRVITFTMPNPDTDEDLLIPISAPNGEEVDELSVPIPHIRHHPYIGIGKPMNSGGVTTDNFRVQEEPMQAREAYQETQQSGVFQRNGPLLGVRAECIRNEGKIQLVGRQSAEFTWASGRFSSSWKKGVPPSVKAVFAITNSYLEQKWEEYKQALGHHNTVEEHYHGTTLVCNIAKSQKFCSDGNCGICGISCSGLDPQCIRKNIAFQRFGSGFYLAPNSSKCHDYTKGAHGYRAMLLCDVLPGQKHILTANDQNLTSPPPGFHSVYGQVTPSSPLNYPEIVLYERHAVMPRHIIMYERDGINRTAN